MGHEGGYIEALAWSPAGTWVASGGMDGAVRVWDALAGETHWCRGQAESVQVLAWSPDGTRLASAGAMVHIWQA